VNGLGTTVNACIPVAAPDGTEPAAHIDVHVGVQVEAVLRDMRTAPEGSTFAPAGAPLAALGGSVAARISGRHP